MAVAVRRLISAAAFTVLATAGAAAAGGGQRATTVPQGSLLTPSLAGVDNFMLYCAPCHGRDGRGNGPVATALKTAPADLTRISIRNRGLFPADRVRQFVTSGGDVAAHGTSAMPVWGPTFRALDSSDTLVAIRIANVVAYLESIQQ